MSSLLLGVALALAAPQAKDPPKREAPSVVGEWEGVSTTLDGRPFGLEPLPLTFADGKVTARERDGTVAVTGTYVLNRAKNPAEIDITWAGMIHKGIYKIDGDSLTICIVMLGLDRPTAFEKPGGRYLVTVYKRVKKKD